MKRGAPLIDLTGARIGRLTVSHRAANVGRATAWACRCDCGAELAVIAFNLRKQPPTRSCGCLAADYHARRRKAAGKGEVTR